MADRVWDRFLTPSDKEHIAASRDKRVGFGARPALLLIDLYRSVFGDKPEPLMEAIKTWPGSCGMAGWNALPHIQKLLAAARAKPGALNFGSAGTGSSLHLTGEYFKHLVFRQMRFTTEITVGMYFKILIRINVVYRACSI